jgi:hypothetical protein
VSSTPAARLASLKTVWWEWLITHNPKADPPYEAVLRDDPKTVLTGASIGDLEVALLIWDRERIAL